MQLQGQLYAFLSGVFLVLAVTALRKWRRKSLFYKKLPRELKDEKGNFIVHESIVRIIESTHSDLLETAPLKSPTNRSPRKILKCPKRSEAISKYVYTYYDDFTDEISDGRLDWNNENTRLFFNLMEDIFGVTNRELLKTVLYLRHEIDYFEYRDSLREYEPKSQSELLKKAWIYNVTNEQTPISKYKIKRMLRAEGFGLPKLPMDKALEKAWTSLEVECFGRDFAEMNEPITELSRVRMLRASWEEMLKVAFDKGFDISHNSYSLISKKHRGHRSKIDKYLRKTSERC